MRIALFGGSFDPPHIAHQMACLYALETHDLDEVWMVPCFRHPFDKRTQPFHHRVQMCRLAAAGVGPRVRVSTIEEELGGQSYTLVTVKALQARHPEHDFALVIGADLIKERERWYGWPELSRLVPFVVLGRGGVGDGLPVAGAQGSARDDGALAARQHHEPFMLPAVSSTEVRARLAQGDPPAGWVARPVLAYIREHGLYTPGSGPPPRAT